MNYRPFLNRDFKSLLDTKPPKSRWQWGSLHWLVIASFIAVISTVLIFASPSANSVPKASLTKNKQTAAPLPVEQAQTVTSNKFITLPLALNPAGADQPNQAQGDNFKVTQTAAVIPHANRSASNTPNESSAQSAARTTTPLPLGNDITPLAIKIKTGDSLANLFRRNNLSAQTLHKIVKLGKPTRALRNIQPGQMLRIQLDANNELQQLVYEMDRFNSLSIQRQGDSFTAKKLTRQTQKRTHFAHGVIERSLFEDGKQAGLSTGLIMDLAGIFGWDIDFALDLRKGDQFSLIYEEHFLDGKKVQDGPILAAQFTSQGRHYKAIRFVDDNGFANYYTPQGLSMRKAFLRTPVDFRRISSRFGNRKHPTLNRMRMHKGVDYAARRGTPIKASGDGKVIFKGRKGGYGRAVIIKHGGRYSTLYAHMKSYRRGIYVGKKVKQGQIIGYVGSSGRATGPHLHYEFRVNGVHRNPLTVKLPNAAPIAKKYRRTFTHYATSMIARLDSYMPTQVASNLASPKP